MRHVRSVATRGCVTAIVALSVRRAADQLINLYARVSDRLEPRLRILPRASVQ